jgi:hypothetical protein
MVLLSLWMPILVSAVLVFIASSILHMVLPFHRSDFRAVPAEDDVMENLRRHNIPPGDYLVPAPHTADFAAKREKGPVVVMTVLPAGPVSMGRSLLLWFLYSIAVGVLAGYVARIALGPGAGYPTVFRIVGIVAFAGYAMALWQNWIWYGRSFSAIFKSTIDAVIYAALTAGTFGWLWPR